MNLTTWLDVAIGMVLIFLGASLMVTVINEYITQTLNLRGKHLCGTLLSLINDTGIRAKLANVPALAPFFKAGEKALSYVDPNVLARMLIGSVDGALPPGGTVKDIGAAIDKMPASTLKKQLRAIAGTAGDKVDDLITAVSAWADRSLTMLGEVYKRKLQLISLGMGFVVAVAFNVDAVGLTERLYRDKEAREATAAVAVQFTEGTSKAAFDSCAAKSTADRKADPACKDVVGLLDAIQGRNASLGRLPLGWGSGTPATPGAWGLKLAGWLLTAFAVSFGAPFWFDLLNKFVNIRHAMRKPEVKAAGTIV